MKLTRATWMILFLVANNYSAQHPETVHGVFVMNSDGTGQEPLFPYPLDARTPAVSPDGSRIAYAAVGRRGFDIWVCELDGKKSSNLTNSAGVSESDPSWSADGSQIVFSSDRDGNFDLFVMDSHGKNVVKVTNDPASDITPSWSPTNDLLAFSSDRNGASQIFVTRPDGSETQQLTFSGSEGVYNFLPRWSPDGTELAFVSVVGHQRQIHVLSMNTNVVRPVLVGSVWASYPSWSPDGALIACSVTEAGGEDIYAVQLDGGRSSNLTRDIGVNSFPVWLSDGRLIFVTRRSADEMRSLGPTMITTIVEGGGVSFTKRAGDASPYRLRRTRPDGTFEYIPLTLTEAERLLRQQGLSTTVPR